MAGDPTFALAERVVGALDAAGVASALIGAGALAAHGYARSTQDLDLAVSTDPTTRLRAVADRLRAEGCATTLELPDADDPLGGVLRVELEGADPVEVVNFVNPFRDRNKAVGGRSEV